MGKKDERPDPRLFLITPAKIGTGFVDQLRSAVAGNNIASVLIWGEASEGDAYLERAKLFVPVIQEHNIAALLRGNSDFVRQSGADGFHSDTDIEDLKQAISKLKPNYIIGAANLRSKHDAMEAGEAGADYLFFGDPIREVPLEDLVERTDWWQSLFEPPCVAYANTVEAVNALTQAGANFIARRMEN